jgi:hypothetical protein
MIVDLVRRIQATLRPGLRANLWKHPASGQTRIYINDVKRKGRLICYYSIEGKTAIRNGKNFANWTEQGFQSEDEDFGASVLQTEGFTLVRGN